MLREDKIYLKFYKKAEVGSTILKFPKVKIMKSMLLKNLLNNFNILFKRWKLIILIIKLKMLQMIKVWNTLRNNNLIKF